MNERIQELARQAGWTEGYYESDDGPFIEPEFNKEKFAELIVRECMRVVEDYYMDPCSYADEAIKEHFGVEE
jgi:hypothetical protein